MTLKAQFIHIFSIPQAKIHVSFAKHRYIFWCSYILIIRDIRVSKLDRKALFIINNTDMQMKSAEARNFS